MKCKSWYLLRTQLSRKLLALHKSGSRATLNFRIAIANANNASGMWD